MHILELNYAALGFMLVELVEPICTFLWFHFRSPFNSNFGSAIHFSTSTPRGIGTGLPWTTFFCLACVVDLFFIVASFVAIFNVADGDYFMRARGLFVSQD
jgi:hypothetical protein